MCVHVRASLCMWMCLCVCVRVFIYVCAHAHVCVCLWAYKVHAWVCMWGHLRAQSTCECMCVCGELWVKSFESTTICNTLPSPSTCCLLGPPSSEGQALEMIIWHTLLISEPETTQRLLLQRPVHGNSGSHSTTTTVCQQARPFTSIPHWPSG